MQVLNYYAHTLRESQSESELLELLGDDDELDDELELDRRFLRCLRCLRRSW